MKIFQAEKNLGLERAILSNACIAYRSQLVSKSSIQLAVASSDGLTSVSTYDDTLYPMMDVLVSTGENLNHDVFNNIKTWPARNSPKYKPLDLEHDQNQIIGSIVGTRIINDDLQVIDDGPDAPIPDSFHILNDSVVYRTWADSDKLAATDVMIEEIKAGEWFVSMECQFDGFDYFVVSPDGISFTIPRDEETAFLTKYLAAYEGCGYYTDASTGDKYHIAREMNNITFIGKGLVREPGNPNSIIFTNASQKTVYKDKELVNSNIQEIITMPDETKDVQTLKDRNVALETTIASLTQKLTERDEAAFASIKAEKTQLEATVANLTTQVAALTESVNQLSKAKADMDEEAAEKDEKIKAMEDEKTKCSRKDKMVKAGADEDEAEAKAEEFANLSDAQFDSLIATLSKGWAASDTSTAGKKLIDTATVIKDPIINGNDATTAAKKDEVPETLKTFVSSYLTIGKTKKSK